MSRNRNFQVHDPEDFCKTGDKVVVRQCRKLSATKYYSVRNIVLPIGRMNLTGEPSTQFEADALKFNKELRQKPLKMYF